MNHFNKNQNRLEKWRGVYFQLGLIIAGGLTLLAFEWTTPVTTHNFPKPPDNIGVVDELPPITYSSDPIKPKVIITPPQFNPDVIDIIPDNPSINDKEPDINPEPQKDLAFDPEWTEPTPIEPIEPTPFTIVEKMPDFIGGEKALYKFLANNIKYPKEAIKYNISGKVYLRFVVSKTGEIKNIEVIRGVNKWLDDEAIRVVKAMPEWNPGKQRGKAVDVSYNLPINFELK